MKGAICHSRVDTATGPGVWSGPTDPIEAAAVAASLAVRSTRPRPIHRDDVWSSARARAWELLERGAVDSWAGLQVATRHQALATSRSLVSWRPESEVRRSGRPADEFTITSLAPDDPTWVRTLHESERDDAPSPALRRLHRILDRIVTELTGRGLDPDRARDAVETVVEHPETRRGAGRARRRLIDDGFANVSAAALVALVLGYPTRGVPGLVERELRGLTGWSHPCVPRLLDLTVHPRGSRLRGMWQDPAA